MIGNHTNRCHTRITEGKLITQYKGSGAKDAADDYRRVASELLREMGA